MAELKVQALAANLRRQQYLILAFSKLRDPLLTLNRRKRSADHGVGVAECAQPAGQVLERLLEIAEDHDRLAWLSLLELLKALSQNHELAVRLADLIPTLDQMAEVLEPGLMV